MASAPNVIVCLCDQLRAFEVGCYGHPSISTPHLDRLAAEGVRYEIAVTNNPVCTPARCCMLSGQYSRTCTGDLANTNALWPNATRSKLPDPLLPERFRDAGYETGLIGKWHVWDDPLKCGFDSAVYPKIIHRHYDQEYVQDAGDPFVVHEFGPDFEGRRLASWLGRKRDQPFFLYYNISQPHMPVGRDNAPPHYLHRYHRDDLPLRPNVYVDGKMADDREWFLIYNDPDYWYRMWKGEPRRPTDTMPDDYDLRQLTADYAGLVTCCDDQVGVLMALLREHSLDDNTIVVFASDHGDNLGSHHQFNKQLMIEESIRVPMIFWSPNQLKPITNHAQVAQIIDVAPTLLDLAGLDPSSHMQGRSLRPTMHARDAELSENWAFIESPSLQVGVRTPTHTYAATIEGNRGGIVDDRFQCFDNVRDPYQQHNLVESSTDNAIIDSLRERLTSWHDATPWMEPDAAMPDQSTER